MIPAGKPPISLIALKFSTLFRQLQHHLWKSGETLVYRVMRKHTGTKKPARGGLFSVIQTYMEASEFR